MISVRNDIRSAGESASRFQNLLREFCGTNSKFSFHSSGTDLSHPTREVHPRNYDRRAS